MLVIRDDLIKLILYLLNLFLDKYNKYPIIVYLLGGLIKGFAL